MPETQQSERVPEAPRDPKLSIDAERRRWAHRQLLSDLPQADDDERGDERVAEDWNP